MNILETILKTTYTLHDVKHRLRILKTYVEQKLFGSTEQTEAFSPEDTSWLQSLGEDTFSQFNKNNATQIFEDTQKEIEKIETIVIYLPFQADTATLNQLGVWLKQNFTSSFIFDIKLDPTLIGGCALVKGGIYKDYSLKTKFHEQQDQILTEFRKYFR